MVAAVVLAAPLMSRFQIAWHTFAHAGPGLRHASARAAFSIPAGAAIPGLHRASCAPHRSLRLRRSAAPLSYVAASADAPLWDLRLDVIDRALGFDWKALLSWMNASPVIYALLRPIYLSLSCK